MNLRLRARLNLSTCPAAPASSRTARTAFAPLIIAGFLGLSMPFGGMAEAQTFRFSSFDVQGNERISDSAILTYAGIAPGAVVSGAQVNDALQRLQNTGLFEEVDITPRGGTLVIVVQEYPTKATAASMTRLCCPTSSRCRGGPIPLRSQSRMPT